MAGKKKNTGLGKGLDALFADMEPVATEPPEPAGRKAGKSSEAEPEAASLEASVQRITIDDVKPNATQPRKNFDKEKLQDMAASIKEHGIIQPIIVRPTEKGYEIVAGERRYRAAREAGLKEVPCIVRELTDQENMLFAIVENMQREDLNPIEEAEGLHAMAHTYQLTQEEISKSVGKSRPYITNALRLLNLEPEVMDMVRQGELSAGHGRTLLGCNDSTRQLALAKRTAKEGLSVRTLEALVAGKPLRKKARPRAKDPNVAAIEEDLKRRFGTKVTLADRGRAGKIEIEYYSKEERERLLDLLQSIE